MEFEDPEYFVNEEKGFVEARIVRSGDLTHDSSVRCYTRQSTAKVTQDFIERMDSDSSRVHFERGWHFNWSQFWYSTDWIKKKKWSFQIHFWQKFDIVTNQINFY